MGRRKLDRVDTHLHLDGDLVRTAKILAIDADCDLGQFYDRLMVDYLARGAGDLRDDFAGVVASEGVDDVHGNDGLGGGADDGVGGDKPAKSSVEADGVRGMAGTSGGQESRDESAGRRVVVHPEGEYEPPDGWRPLALSNDARVRAAVERAQAALVADARSSSGARGGKRRRRGRGRSGGKSVG